MANIVVTDITCLAGFYDSELKILKNKWEWKYIFLTQSRETIMAKLSCFPEIYQLTLQDAGQMNLRVLQVCYFIKTNYNIIIFYYNLINNAIFIFIRTKISILFLLLNVLFIKSAILIELENKYRVRQNTLYRKELSL
jgi:hypothetical protein